MPPPLRASAGEAESLETGLVLAGLDALRQISGDEVMRRILGQATAAQRPQTDESGRVPIVDYLHYRNTAVEVLGDKFQVIAFETGRTLVRNLRHPKVDEIRNLVERMADNPNKLFLIGQAAVLAARHNPGVVRAAFKPDGVLAITIEACPECRGLERKTPFCFLNQGVIVEFAERYLDARVHTEETRCMAQGDPVCQTEVALEG